MNEVKCARCGGQAYLMRPEGLGGVTLPHKIYSCPTCGANTSENGKILLTNIQELKQISTVAAASKKMTEGMPELQKLVAAAKSLFEARAAEYGIQMWFDGYKHGLLVNAIASEYDKRTKGDTDV